LSPTSAAVHEADPNGLALQHQALQTLTALPVGLAIGAACSFLLYCAYNHRVEFRRVMNDKVIREGFRGVSLLDIFKRVSS
jgi:hypothetical protein